MCRCAERTSIIVRVATGKSDSVMTDAGRFAQTIAQDVSDMRLAAASRIRAARARLLRR